MRYLRGFFAAGCIAAFAVPAMADNNIGCGLGTQLWKGQWHAIPFE